MTNIKTKQKSTGWLAAANIDICSVLDLLARLQIQKCWDEDWETETESHEKHLRTYIQYMAFIMGVEPALAWPRQILPHTTCRGQNGDFLITMKRATQNKQTMRSLIAHKVQNHRKPQKKKRRHKLKTGKNKAKMKGWPRERRLVSARNTEIL